MPEKTSNQIASEIVGEIVEEYSQIVKHTEAMRKLVDKYENIFGRRFWFLSSIEGGIVDFSSLLEKANTEHKEWPFYTSEELKLLLDDPDFQEPTSKKPSNYDVHENILNKTRIIEHTMYIRTLKEMPKYLDHEYGWVRAIARWRLKINK